MSLESSGSFSGPVIYDVLGGRHTRPASLIDITVTTMLVTSGIRGDQLRWERLDMTSHGHPVD
jgi:hypothetical protein